MIRFILVLALSLTSLTEVIGQKTETFHDTYGLQGQLKYLGSLSDTALPKNGPFELQWREIENNLISSYYTKGNLKNHQPTGAWTWEEASWKQKINVGSTISPNYQTAGKRAKWSGKFLNGLQDGKWIYNLDSIALNGQVKQKLLRIELVYKEGKPMGNFKLEEFGTTLPIIVVGQTVNGLANGTWKYTYKKTNGTAYSEERVYREGLLLETKILDGTQKSTIEFKDNQQYFLEANKAQLPFQIGSIQFDMDNAQDSMSEWLKAQLTLRFQTGWSLAHFPHEVHFFTPMYKRLKYPLSETENENKQLIQQEILSQNEKINGVLVDHMEIHRTRNTTLDTTVSYLELLSNRLSIIDSFMLTTENELFFYQTRETSQFKSLTKKLEHIGIGKSTTVDSLVVTLSNNSLSDSSANIFASLKDLLAVHANQLPTYIQVVEDAHLSVKQEAELQEMEEKILEKLALQQQFYASTTGLNHTIKSRWIEKEIPLNLQKYAQTDSFQAAKVIGLQVMVLLDSLQAWQNQTTHLDRADSTFKATYTLLAYNPYTGANDITMVVKKRFLATITSQIWPYLMADLEATKNWNEWSIKWNKAWDYYNYFLQFVSMDDKDSKRVEKKVRKEKKVERMLKTIDHHLEDLHK